MADYSRLIDPYNASWYRSRCCNECDRRELYRRREYEGLIVQKYLGNWVSVEKPMKLTALAKRILDSDTRVLVEAGWLSADLSLTSEGEEAFLTHYLQAHKKELAEEARKVIAEKKEDDK